MGFPNNYSLDFLDFWQADSRLKCPYFCENSMSKYLFAEELWLHIHVFFFIRKSFGGLGLNFLKNFGHFGAKTFLRLSYYKSRFIAILQEQFNSLWLISDFTFYIRCIHIIKLNGSTYCNFPIKNDPKTSLVVILYTP